MSLEKKLEHANREETRTRLTIVAVVLAIFVIGSLLLVNIDLLDRLDRATGGGLEQYPTSMAVKIPPSSEVVQGMAEANLSQPPAGEEPVQRDEPEARKVQKSDSAASTTAPAETADSSDTHELRDAFKAALRSFEEDISRQVQGDGFATWDKEAQYDVIDARERAVRTFSQGDYETAIATLEDARRQAHHELEARDAAFSEAMQLAVDSLRADDYDQALINITKAGNWLPNHESVAPLRSQIEALPAVLKHIVAAKIRRAENDLDGELAEIKRALALDSSRNELSRRAQILVTEIRDKAFLGAIRQGLAGIDREELELAKDGLSNARSIDAGREEVVILAAEVDGLERRSKTTDLLRKAANHAGRDDWRTAKEIYAEALTVQPTSDLAVHGHRRAADIITLSDEISGHLKTQDRLTASNVARLAQDTVRRAESLTLFSPRLATASKKLEDTLTLYAQEVDIWVNSDGETAIAVRGVGRVGKTPGRVIQLKPGAYTFEGTRAGYRSKLVRLSVPAGAGKVEVTVICDELI